MSKGGGFCPKHGPFDPPHTSCPFCAREDPQRRAFGPPPLPSYRPRTRPRPEKQDGAPDDRKQEAPPDEFHRETVEPEGPQVTEVAPAQAPDGTALEAPPLAEGQRLPLGWLIVKEPPDRRGEVLAVKHGQIIGREGDLRWIDPKLSRQHARFTIEPVGETSGARLSGTLAFHLWPFAPTNPVIINGKTVRAATPLNENDEILLGDTLFVFKTITD